MKKERKPKTPIFAAHSANKNGEKPAPARKKELDSSRSKIADSLDVSSLPEQNPSPIMRFTRDGETLYMNQAAASLLAFSVEKPVPDEWRDLIRSSFESGLNTEVELKHQDKVFAALVVPMSESGYVNIYYRDVTDQKRMQVALSKSEERFRQAADASGALVYEVDLVSGTTTIVHGMKRLTGYDPHEITSSGEWWRSLIHPDDLPMHLMHLDELLKKGGTDMCEYRLLHKSGNWIHVQDNRLVFQNETGQNVRLIGTSIDITDRKHAEEELRQLNLLLKERVEKRTLQLETSDQLRRKEMFARRQAQDRFAKSFDSSPAAMTITRFEDGMYRNVNPKFIELLGYELDEAIGHTTLDLKIYKNPEERSDLLRTIRENNGKWEYETQLQTKAGKLLDVNISVVEIELDGEPHILSMIMDITERNQILAALRTSEQQLRTLFDLLPVGISYVTPDGKVIESNRTLEKIIDSTRKEIQNGPYRSRQYIRPDGSPMPVYEFASTRALREQRTINNVETGIVKEGGQVIWASVSATPISMPEPGAVVITVDVTERKHMDDELRRSYRRYQVLSRRLVEIQEEERRTISRELHDRVGQSLAALNLNLNFLNSSLSGTTSLPIKSRLKDAIQLTEETVSTIRDVMANLRPPALDDYGLEAALNAYVDPFSRRFGIRVVLVKPANPVPRMNPNVELTLLRIAQEALTNIARHANARQATVTLLCQNDMVHLTIEDNGEGIRSWQKANRPGSHGLKIMRERAETFGGTLQVQSFNRKGTRIEVKIPIQGNDQPTTSAESD